MMLIRDNIWVVFWTLWKSISIVGWDGKSNLYPTVISIIIFNAIMKAIKKTNIVPPVYIALFHLLTHTVSSSPHSLHSDGMSEGKY